MRGGGKMVTTPGPSCGPSAPGVDPPVCCVLAVTYVRGSFCWLLAPGLQFLSGEGRHHGTGLTRPRKSALPERPQELFLCSSPGAPLVLSSSPWPTLVPSSSPLAPLVPSSSPSPPLALSSSPSTAPERPPEMGSFPKKILGGGYPPWPPKLPDPP